ncbi:outer membrane beta-barrel protein [candidate division KSB1 bacterium]|nr:outer membrane beta-barrel protein [candidate division KSB1 bacterium]
MKTHSLIVTLLLVLCGALFAQNKTTVTVLAGYTMSAFEDQEEAAGTLAGGVRAGYMASPQIEVGAEFQSALGGYTYEMTLFDVTMETSFNQNVFGIYGKYLIPAANFKPFVKAGLGYYFGDAKVESDDELFNIDESVSIDAALGFNFGIGAHLTRALSAEFNYHIVSREMEGESIGMNAWAILVGYNFKL